MKGWVYIITNKAMPDLLKVGFSTKDPELRADELHTTGIPHRYVVEYDVLVHEPYTVEQKAHMLLKSYHENKEWFKCDIPTAIIAIRQAANNTIILESNKHDLINYRQTLFEEKTDYIPYNLRNISIVMQHDTKLLEWFLKVAEQAEQGNVDAQSNLGDLYRNGEGVIKNYSKAFEWYLKAAEQGNMDAQSNLGDLYRNGQSVIKNYSKAFEWYLKSAEQGVSCAQNNLGKLYECGNGVTQDYSKAFEWYLKAAEQGNYSAIEALKKMEKGMLHKL